MWSRRTREYRVRVQLLFAYCEAIVQKLCLLFKSLCKYKIIASMSLNTGLVVCSWLHYLELTVFLIACHLDLAHAWNQCPLEIMFFRTYVCLYLLLHGVGCVSNMTSLFKSKTMASQGRKKTILVCLISLRTVSYCQVCVVAYTEVGCMLSCRYHMASCSVAHLHEPVTCVTVNIYVCLALLMVTFRVFVVLDRLLIWHT